MIKDGTKEIERRAIEMKFVNHMLDFSSKIDTTYSIVLFISRFYAWSEQYVSTSFVVAFVNYRHEYLT